MKFEDFFKNKKGVRYKYIERDGIQKEKNERLNKCPECMFRKTDYYNTCERCDNRKELTEKVSLEKKMMKIYLEAETA